MGAMREAALAYAEQGYSVFPCVPGEKRPLTMHGLLDASKDSTEVEGWWILNPDANVAMPTGAVNGVSVIDLDGPLGIAWAKAQHLPRTWTIRTPRGGLHLYYAYHQDLHTGSAFAEQVDVRNNGGYVLLLPSVVNGKPYTVALDAPVARLDHIPQELRVRTRERREPPQQEREPHWVTQALGGVPESQRNDTATRLIGYFHHKGMTEDIIGTIMEQWAGRCSPAFDLSELHRTIMSVTRYPQGGSGIKGIGNESILIP